MPTPHHYATSGWRRRESPLGHTGYVGGSLKGVTVARNINSVGTFPNAASTGDCPMAHHSRWL
jgi:hypothetical protein